MDNNKNVSTNVDQINDKLSEVKTTLQDLFALSLEEIKSNPSAQEKVLSQWSEAIKDLGDFFFKESERTKNDKIYKTIMRSLMFKHR